MDTLQTVFHAYRFNTRNAEEKRAWLALKDTLKDYPHCMESHGGNLHYMPELDGAAITLETAHLFDNQWNTAPIGTSKTGLRVFDWALDYQPNRDPYIKQGHYIEQTESMREARRNRMKCNYCGNQEPAQKGLVFCDKCMDSPYLKESDLHLLRMDYVTNGRGAIAPLTAAESAHLLPLYRAAQIHGSTVRGKARIAKQRADISKEFEQTIRQATQKRDGITWMMDHGISTENVIYYSHTEKFSFGWRTKYSAETAAALESELVGFPFAFTIERA